MEQPTLGFGTHCLKKEITRQCVLEALRCGYRFIDTASAYGNEEEVGQAVQEAGIPRHQLWMQTKLSPKEMGSKAEVLEAFHRSRVKLKVEYVDCYIMHWPAAAGKKPNDPEQVKLRREAYCAMLELRRQGFVRNVGVSNFLPRHIQSLEGISGQGSEKSIKPVEPDPVGAVAGEGGGEAAHLHSSAGSSSTTPYLNQIELHPLCHQQAVVDYCVAHGIRVQAYSPLGRGEMLRDEKVLSTARKLTSTGDWKNSELEGLPISPSDVVLWLGLMKGYQGGYIVRSSSPDHIRANFTAWKTWESHLAKGFSVPRNQISQTKDGIQEAQTKLLRASTSQCSSLSHKRCREGDDDDVSLPKEEEYQPIERESESIADNLDSLQKFFSDCRASTHQRQLAEGSECRAPNPKWALGDQGDLHYCWWSKIVLT